LLHPQNKGKLETLQWFCRRNELVHTGFAPSIRAAEEETDLTVAHLCKMLVLRAKHLYEKRKQRNIFLSRQLFTFHSAIYMYLMAYREILYDAPKTSKNLKETKRTWNIK